MKTAFLILISAIIVSACNPPAKELATVKIGMTKTEVTGIVGEPKKKNSVNKTEIWDYPDSARTIVFRSDTVYAIMTSPKARLDSMKVWVDSADTKTKKAFSKVGEKLEKAGDKLGDVGGKIGNKFKRDTTKSN